MLGQTKHSLMTIMQMQWTDTEGDYVKDLYWPNGEYIIRKCSHKHAHASFSLCVWQDSNNL